MNSRRRDILIYYIEGGKYKAPKSLDRGSTSYQLASSSSPNQLTHNCHQGGESFLSVSNSEEMLTVPTLSILLVALLLVSAVQSFTTSSNLLSRRISLSKPIARLNTELMMAESNPNGYWEGEWICADCGYIYDQDVDGGGLYFEQLKKGFVCPQCSAPRKRYAKKVGDQWGVTRDAGDFPIYFTTFIGLAVTTW